MNKASALICTVLLLVATMASCSGGKNKAAVQPLAGNAAHATYEGIDVSRHQKVIDWDKVGADNNITFVYVKATEGATLVDSCYRNNVNGARRKGIKVGAYHYFTTKSSVNAQVKNFVRQLKSVHQDLIPMIDVETRGNWSRSQLIDSLSKMAVSLEKTFKRKPMIYSTMEFYNDNLAPHFNAYPLYIARYSNARPTIKWNGKHTIWQFTEDGIVTGISKKVDLCRFNKGITLDDIKL